MGKVGSEKKDVVLHYVQDNVQEVVVEALAAPAQRKNNRWGGKCEVCGFHVRPREGWLHGPQPVHRFCDTGTPDWPQLKEYLMDRKWQLEHAQDLEASVIGEGDTPPPDISPKASSPAAFLAYSFQEYWFDTVLPKYPEWRRHRCINIGAAVGYIRTQFLSRGYSQEHVEAYFDAFFTELMYPSSELEVKEGQTPWQLFTGWWGTVSVEDPAIEQARLERRAHLRSKLEELNLESAEREEAAWTRIEAAWAAGEQPAVEDVRTVQRR